MSWQPIDSAPKDRTILICGGKWWIDDDGSEFPLAVPTTANWRRDKWWIGNGDAYNVEFWADPTHWMPLPAPPEAA